MTSRTSLAGAPRIMLRGGKTLSCVTSEPAPTMLCAPITQPFSSVLPMPIERVVADRRAVQDHAVTDDDALRR